MLWVPTLEDELRPEEIDDAPVKVTPRAVVERERAVYVERPRKSFFAGCGWLLLIVIGLPVAISLGLSDSRPASRPAPSREARNAVFTGETVPVRRLTWAGTTKANLDALVSMAVAEDAAAILGMVAEGRAVELEAGTKVHVIETGLAAYKVRLPGQAGPLWVVREALE